MFRVSLDSLIIVYLALLIGFLSLVWIAAEIARLGRERRRRRDFIICGICDHIYEDRSENQLVNCPRCGALNERGRVQEI
jgi:hypothetical protein